MFSELQHLRRRVGSPPPYHIGRHVHIKAVKRRDEANKNRLKNIFWVQMMSLSLLDLLIILFIVLYLNIYQPLALRFISA